MKKKLFIVVVDVLIILCVVLGIRAITGANSSKGEKNIDITIVEVNNGETELMHKNVDTDAATLTEVLKENEDFKAEFEDGEYGSFLTSLAGKQQSADKGPWWVFESENNEVCVKSGMCPAIDEVVVKDGDTFKFKLTSSFE